MPQKKTAAPKKTDDIFCQKEKLAILGTAETMAQAPWDDEEFEIWGVAQVSSYPVWKRAELLFEIHEASYWKKKPVIDRLNKFAGPIYMMEKYDEITNSIRFPLEKILKIGRPYHSTSISYMLAWALRSYQQTKKPCHVELWGVHMAAKEEYTSQRPCCEYWIGLMQGQGMSVSPPPGGALFTASGLYAYEGYHPVIPELRQRLDALSNGANQRDNELQKAKANLERQRGAIIECEHWMGKFQRGEIGKDKIISTIEEQKDVGTR